MPATGRRLSPTVQWLVLPQGQERPLQEPRGAACRTDLGRRQEEGDSEGECPRPVSHTAKPALRDELLKAGGHHHPGV
jgi:hypothetical protein